MFAFICFQSDKEEIQNMGVACLAYLVIIHVFCFFVEDRAPEQRALAYGGTWPEPGKPAVF